MRLTGCWPAGALVVDGEPEQRLAFLNDPDTNLPLIMKGGRLYANRL